MRFAHPWFLLLLAAVPLFLWWQLGKRRAAVVYSDLGFLRGVPNRGKLARPLVNGIYALALIAMVVALARPQQGRRLQDVETSGIDIMLCLDISETMLTPDFAPRNRLEVAKQRAKEFVERRQGDRIGLVVFATQSMTQCPLTLDRDVLARLIDHVQVGMLEQRTAIGLGIATAAARLRGSRAREKVVILLTDGRNNTGDIDPLTAAQVAASFGIKVYTIGVGSRERVFDPSTGRQRSAAEVELDTVTLRNIADATGARSFLATDPEGLRQVYEEIDRMQPTTFRARRYTVYNELAGLPLRVSLGLLLAGMVLAGTVLRRLP
ncbi:VWA domain-containing protein [candidate division WOR-3 bacterium]|nr:VWA domain-containing protein [candidate division WOR-3 bacterium]